MEACQTIWRFDILPLLSSNRIKSDIQNCGIMSKDVKLRHPSTIVHQYNKLRHSKLWKYVKRCEASTYFHHSPPIQQLRHSQYYGSMSNDVKFRHPSTIVHWYNKLIHSQYYGSMSYKVKLRYNSIILLLWLVHRYNKLRHSQLWKYVKRCEALTYFHCCPPTQST